jgi:type II secretory pathway pseudopilin PulG
LLELIAVVTVVGLLAAAAVTRFGTGAESTIGAEADARRIALDLLQAQRRSIGTGNNHFVQFNSSGGAVVSYTLYRRTGSGDVQVESLRMVPTGVTVTASHSVAEYNFEGQALAAYSITVSGPSRSWTVSVVPVSGAIRCLAN